MIDDIRVDHNCEVTVITISRKLTVSVARDTPVVKKIMTATGNCSPFEPILQLEDDEMRNLTDIIVRIKKYLKMTDYVFQSHIVRSDAGVFIMEVGNILLQRSNERKPGDRESRKEEIVREFIRLIVKYVGEQYEVAFYAKELCITPGNLSRIIAAASGKSPLQWIGNALVVEAKILLHKPDATIKQVSNELHFGNQSSFGKFFRKHTGLTPVEYKARCRQLCTGSSCTLWTDWRHPTHKVIAYHDLAQCVKPTHARYRIPS